MTIPARRLVSVFALLSLCACRSGPAPLSAQALRTHVETLASDDMLGRETGTEGALRAAAYIASVLEQAGYARGGGMDSYLQDIGVWGWVTRGDLSAEFLAADGSRLEARHGVDLTWLRGPPKQLSLELRLAATREQIPDAPDAQAALVLPVDGRTAMGWLGRDRGDGWGAVIFMGPTTPGDPSPPPAHLIGDADDAALLMARGPLAEDLAAGLFTTLNLRLDADDPVASANVVGVLPSGGYPDQAVVLTAHYDHLGLADDGEDRIYNGADDDASGVAVVLEIARALAEDRNHRRTVVVLLVTGEERGMLGSRAYVQAPTVPLHATVANLNFEMLGRPDPVVGGPGVVWLTGWNRSDLGPTLAAQGLPIVPDPRPSEDFFNRSDNIVFAQQGIVAQTFSTFGLHDDYHHVTDEADRLDYEHMQACAEAGYAAARLLVGRGVTPSWTEGGRPD